MAGHPGLDVYQEAFYSNALMLIRNIDLTGDSIPEPLTLHVNGERKPLLELVGMGAPCRYSEFIRNWANQHIEPENRRDFLANFDREALLRRFEDGQTRVQVSDSYSGGGVRGREGRIFLRHSLFLERGETGHVILRDIVRDVTEQALREQALRLELEKEREANRKLRYTDPLTGFLNKQGFLREVARLLDQEPDCQFALCYSDVSNLSYVNSVYGYDVGSRLLQVWSDMTHKNLKSGELLGRISGDYFATFTRAADQAAILELEQGYSGVVDYVNRLFQEEYPHFHVDIYTGAYLISPKEWSELPVERMLNRAAIAQKSAKDHNDKTVRFYNPQQWSKRSRIIRISQSLDPAIAEGHIRPWFQPQYDYESGRLTGAEVLCRWKDPTLDWIPPDEFIPALERTGQVYQLDTYIWEQACAALRKWLDMKTFPVVPLSVNISRYDIQQEDFLERLSKLLEKYDLTPDMLRLEITESAYMEEPDALVEMVGTLRDRGFVVDMDDFGSGYSSLSMLKEVPVNTLKMDLRFLSQESADKRGGSIISSVIRMAQGLNIAVIAEGVETSVQAESLKNMGCYIMQGYYFFKPMPLEEFERICRQSPIGERLEKPTDESLTYIYDIMDNSSKSSYIFNHYSSAEAILEFDGEHMEIMSINDPFLKVIGDRDGAARSFMKDGLALVSEEHRPRALEALEKAVRDGQAECEVYIPATQQWVNVTFRHVLKSHTVDYLFCEAVNTTDKHELSALMRSVLGEVNLMPAGLFRYAADGEQEFTFISDGLLTLLDYPSEEAFRAKFHNRFPEMVYHEDRERVLSEIDRQIAATGGLDYCEYRIETGSGQLKWVYDHGHLVTDEDGKRWFYVVIADLDEVKRGRQEQDWQARKYQTLTTVPGTNLFDYELKTDTLRLFRTGKDGRVEAFTLGRFLERMDREGWTTPRTAGKIREMVARAGSAPVRGALPYEGRVRDIPFRGVLHYAGVPDMNGKICGIVGNILGAEEACAGGKDEIV